MNWRDAHEQAMFAAAEAHDDRDVELSRRIDVFSIIEELGIALIFRPLRGASGLFFPGPSAAQSGVLISSQHPLARQRFTGAHELGHFWLGHEPSVDFETEVLGRATMNRLAPQEMVAEAFAAWFLMPPELVDHVLEELSMARPTSPEDVYALSLRLGTSYQATAYHLPNLKLIGYDTASRWARQPPRQVKAALSLGAVMSSYHHDVWSLSERDADAAFEIRAGDRLVVTLPEVPSSGLMWSTGELPSGATVVADTMHDRLDDDDGASLPPGSATPRTLIVDVSEDAAGPLDLALTKAPVWAPRDAAERFLVHLQVQQPLLGRPVRE